MKQLTLQKILQQSPLSLALQGQGSIYVYPNIPDKKLLGAQHYLPKHVQQAGILILVDDTVFGSAKAGLCITPDGLYYKADFAELVYCPFHQIQTICADVGLMNRSLFINQQLKFSFTQPERQGVQALATLLNTFVQQNGNAQFNHAEQQAQGSYTAHTDLAQVSPAIQSALALQMYVAAKQTGRINENNQELLFIYFSELGEEAKQYFLDHIQDTPVLSFVQILNYLRKTQSAYSHDYKCVTLDLMMRLMIANHYEFPEMLMLFDEISSVLQISKHDAKRIAAKIMEEIQRFEQQEWQQHNSRFQQHHAPFSELTAEQQQACQLLGLLPEQLSTAKIKQAYRKKISEFHPDQYQQLPESVRLVIEQQAQQLNHARDILMCCIVE